jgi:ferritin-like metal-binding protein YciE
MATEHQELIRWLNDAYMMELAIEENLSRHRAAAADFPQWRERLQQHVEQTRDHANAVRSCIERFGGTVSTSKTLVGELAGRVQGLSTAMYKDELVKNILADYAMEHFEIACYESLITAAEQAGQSQVATICEQILEEEEDMAEWLRSQIPVITSAFLLREAALT